MCLRQPPHSVRNAGTSLDIEQLCSAGSERLYAFGFRMLGDPDAALDVVQESFIVALAQADTFRGEAAPMTWLTAIARNLCLKHTRAPLPPGDPRRHRRGRGPPPGVQRGPPARASPLRYTTSVGLLADPEVPNLFGPESVHDS
jgi:hypothetical protein